jgi:hypothetical protein
MTVMSKSNYVNITWIKIILIPKEDERKFFDVMDDDGWFFKTQIYNYIWNHVNNAFCTSYIEGKTK